MNRLFCVVSFAAFLAACQSAPPTMPPTAVAAVATDTPRSTATPTPQPTAAPTNTPAPTATPAIAETLTPAPTATPTAIPTPAAREVFVNADNGLNLRSEPSSAATLVRTLANGARLTAVGAANPPDASGIAWQNVQTDAGQSGWVAAQYLIDTKPAAAAPVAAPPAAPVGASGYVYVAAPDGLNLRADKSASSQLLVTLANGQRLQTNRLTFGPDANGITWLNVKTDSGLEGWVAVSFVTDIVPSVATPAPAANVSDAVAEILRRTNELRRQSGVPEVTLIEDLNHLALDHSQYMAQNGISHTGAGGMSAKQRIINAGYGAGCPTENIYGGQASIDDAWNYWTTDPPHLAVLLNTCNNVLGIGVYKTGFMTYYTMNFGRPAQ